MKIGVLLSGKAYPLLSDRAKVLEAIHKFAKKRYRQAKVVPIKISSRGSYSGRGDLIVNMCRNAGVDILLCHEFSDFCLPIKQFLPVLTVLNKARITVHFIKEDILIEGRRAGSEFLHYSRFTVALTNMIAQLDEWTHDAKRGKRGRPAVLVDRHLVLALRKRGLSLREIAEKLKVSTTTIFAIVKKNKV